MIVGKNDPDRHRFGICIFYRFPQKSFKMHCFMHNAHTRYL